MRLADLLDDRGEGPGIAPAALNLDVAGLAEDSRKVRPGFLFAALPGLRVDGRTFVDDALQRGAVAVLAPPGTDLATNGQVPLIADPNPRRRFALMAARFYGRQPALMAAVTGTNGKTSIAWFLRQIWDNVGHRAASLGTLGVHAPGFDLPGKLTTPDPVGLHSTLAELADCGVDRAVMEASSHGLAQHRLDGVRIAAAAFTNLTRDHLDYHGSMEGYLDAKLRLFADLVQDGGAAVLNADSTYFDAFNAVSVRRGLRVVSYGSRGDDVRVEAVDPAPGGQKVLARVFQRQVGLELPLVGQFQVENALCALALAVACGEDRDACLEALARLAAVPGRMQKVGATALGAPVFVDFAHTPDALHNVLRALRPHARGHLIVVFGCGGDRDRGKRPEMGRIAAALADRVIVTDDNPRSEDPAAIRRAVRAACPDALEIGDRRAAIAKGIAELSAGDLLLVAGKGHESGQIVGSTVYPFDDAAVVRELLGEARP